MPALSRKRWCPARSLARPGASQSGADDASCPARDKGTRTGSRYRDEDTKNPPRPSNYLRAQGRGHPARRNWSIWCLAKAPANRRLSSPFARPARGIYPNRFSMPTARGTAVGNLSSSNILLTQRLWVQLAPSVSSLLARRSHPMPGPFGPDSPLRPLPRPPPRGDGGETPAAESGPRSSGSGGNCPFFGTSISSSSSSFSSSGDQCEEAEGAGGRGRAGEAGETRRGLAALLCLRRDRVPSEDLPLTYRWVKGMVSNLEYLLAVNAAAGRLPGDRSRHPVVPWVSDLVSLLDPEAEGRGQGTGEKAGTRGGGWRDLTMTKFRLKKGDAQVRGWSLPRHPSAPFPCIRRFSCGDGGVRCSVVGGRGGSRQCRPTRFRLRPRRPARRRASGAEHRPKAAL